jgi:phosphohistidine phosphatase
MRHAQAQLEQYGKNDRERTITMAGMHELDAIRQQIHGKLDNLSFIMCSNARRTRQTLDGLKQFLPNSAQVNYDDSLYQAGAECLWYKIQTLSPMHKDIMLVGHNPGLSQMLTAIDSSIARVFPTCGIAICESSVEKWHEISPHNLRVTAFLQA